MSTPAHGRLAWTKYCRIKLTDPATTGVAMLVPAMAPISQDSPSSGLAFAERNNSAANETEVFDADSLAKYTSETATDMRRNAYWRIVRQGALDRRNRGFHTDSSRRRKNGTCRGGRSDGVSCSSSPAGTTPDEHSALPSNFDRVAQMGALSPLVIQGTRTRNDRVRATYRRREQVIPRSYHVGFNAVVVCSWALRRKVSNLLVQRFASRRARGQRAAAAAAAGTGEISDGSWCERRGRTIVGMLGRSLQS